MTIKPGTVLYASDDSQASITDAREYIRHHSLTQDDVRLIRKDWSVMVVAKREITLDG